MSIRIRDIKAESQFCEQVTVEAITGVLGLETIRAVLAECEATGKRQRKLPGLLTLLVCIAMNLWTEVSLASVLVRLVHGTRLLSGDGVEVTANKSAISEARYRLGSEVVEKLFRRVCRPIASPSTVGAYAYGWRLVALDGSSEDVPDTPANEAAFGRPSNQRGQGPFPQVRLAYLCECGTHVIFDAWMGRYTEAEQYACQQLTCSVTADMLVLVDMGLCKFDVLKAIVKQGAQVLARLPSGTKPQVVKTLSDGSVLAYLQPSDYQRRKSGERLLVRLITYTLDDPARPGFALVHRLVTTLLDELAYPAVALICLYHERWEVELTIDELQTHQRLAARPLRSLKPEGVRQELFALFLAHFVVRCTMLQAASLVDLDPDRLSFVSALRLLCDAVPDFQLVHPDLHPTLWSRLLHDVLHFRLPPRDNRINPRVVKRHQSKFPVKRPFHRFLPQPSRSFRAAVVLQ
jgi:Insertion element 4 transposase N-terminal/Transposase DDE domain